MLLKNSLKIYKNHKKLVVFKTPMETTKNKQKGCICGDIICKHAYTSIDELIERLNKSIFNSLNRTKTLITDYVLCNNFELFCTFTFDPKKLNSMDIELGKQKMDNWLSNAKRKSPNLQYILVPEKHKSGALHLHALITNYKPKLKYSGIIEKGRKVYNIGQWKWGFSTAKKIDNILPVAFYMQKYITKDMITTKNKRRYWCSKGLNKPLKENNVDIDKLDLNIQYTGDFLSIYHDFNVL